MSRKQISQKQKGPPEDGFNTHNNSLQYVTTASDCQPVYAFCKAMQAVYGPLDWLPVPDGAINRFHVPGDKQGSENGWYVLYLDGIASGAFGSWKVDGTHTWSSRRPADPLEAQLIDHRREQARRQREAEQHKRQQSAAEYANRLWPDARRADPDHPYLVAKGCLPHRLRQLGHALLVPMYQAGQLVNLQRIFPNGSKWFLEGGKVKGCYSPLGKVTPRDPLYICEGWATGATIHEETGAAVACAMNRGNLLAVGEYLRQRCPEAVPIIAGDDDRETEGNPGRTTAIRAAEELGCGLVLPPWTGAEPQDLSDFNDLRQWRTKR